MIAAMVCAYKSGDVLRFTLEQLRDAEFIHRVLVADGSHEGPWKPGQFVDSPTVEEVCADFPKVEYGRYEGEFTRSCKNNRMLARLDEDERVEWVLTVDSDEVYHEDDLARLRSFMEAGPEYDRWWIRTVDPYPDLEHMIEIRDMKPRLFRWFKGARCPDTARMHQFIDHPSQRRHPKFGYGCAPIPADVCRFFHLNAIRPGGRSAARRIKTLSDGRVRWHGGKMIRESAIYPLDPSTLPRSLREHFDANGASL
jgi:glycosyltransferase involved in cell wall biosynthesis